ncbi:MAG: hypothetical protein SVV03_02580 [Candidatus Nanohaloarchaea archaeon]|nr:hypothetical protein [Candidatus Nanohaloarchaea archaeon]
MTDWFVEAELYEEEEKAEKFNSVYSRGINDEEELEKFLEALEEELRKTL